MGIKERREREKNERRESIFKAAIRVYTREGYHAVTMEKIAEAAELSRATLYLYFKTKDEIFIHAIVAYSDFFTKRLESLYADRVEMRDKLLASLWFTFIDFYENDRESFNATLYFHQSEMIRNLPEGLRLLLDRSGSRNYAYLSKIMAYGIEEGIFRECNAKTLAEVVWTSFLGIIHLENSKSAMDRRNHLEVTRNLALKMLSQGILKRTPEALQ
ncbi:MAG: TetR/AcrR family transcriptional regulator [Deltaproteobacteria bacterium]